MAGENCVMRRSVVQSSTQFSDTKIDVDGTFCSCITHSGDENTHTSYESKSEVNNTLGRFQHN